MIQNKLKYWRYKKEMNQKEFAGWLGVHVTLYNNWERQHRQPSLEWSLKIAYKLNCDVKDIFSITDDE